MANDKNMIAAFNDHLDIHQSTAALVFNVAYEDVTKEQRYRAKTVNFGITYGQSAFALSEQLDIERKEAQIIIDKYYEQFPNIRQFIDDTISFASQNGFVETLYGRRRHIPNILSRKKQLQNAAQRIAVNTRVQGTAMISLSLPMIKIQKAIDEKSLKPSMIIQVHDELLFDVCDDEKNCIQSIIQSEMDLLGFGCSVRG